MTLIESTSADIAPASSLAFVILADNVHLKQLIDTNVASELIGDGVRLCYLDPPFNTGEKFDYYHDAADSTAWYSALVDRLEQVRKVLSPTGSVWLHLDDSEQHRGRLALDEVFGEDAFVATVIWQKRTSRDNRRAFSSSHDYIHVYAPLGPRGWKHHRNGLPNVAPLQNPDNDPRGPWRSIPLSVQAGHGTRAQFYVINSPSGAAISPPVGRCWAYTQQKFEALDREGRIYWPRRGAGVPRLKKFEQELVALAPSTLWLAEDVGDNSTAKRKLLREFPGASVFDTPKPEGLIERIVSIASDPGDWVLDPYLGSGTTGLVAARLGRNWIGIEREHRTLTEMVIPRLERFGVSYELIGEPVVAIDEGSELSA